MRGLGFKIEAARALALRGGWQAVPSQNIANRLVAIAPKNVPEHLRHRYAGRGQPTVLSAVLVF